MNIFTFVFADQLIGAYTSSVFILAGVESKGLSIVTIVLSGVDWHEAKGDLQCLLIISHSFTMKNPSNTVGNVLK